MSTLIKMYICFISHDEFGSEWITSNNYIDLMSKIITNIMDVYLEDYPSLARYKITNSIDFISDTDEEEYRDKLNSIINYLDEKNVPIKLEFIGIDQEINNGNLVNITHEAI